MSSAAQATGSTKVLLLVEDEPLLRAAIAGYLRDCGYRVVEGASLDEALAFLQHGQTAFDIVMTGLADSAKGFQLALWLRQNRPNVPVIMTASVRMAGKAAAELCDEGPTRQRPYDPQLIEFEVRRLLNNPGGEASPLASA